MQLSKASIRYARALYSLAEERGQSELVYDNMHMLMDFFVQSKDIQSLMANPVIPAAVKKRAMRLFFKDNLEELSVNFLCLIIDKNRTTDVYGIVREYVEYYRARKGILRAVIRTPSEMSTEEKMAFVSFLEERFPGQTVEISHKVKPELIGGFTMRIGWQFIDQSVSGRLARLRRKINEKYYKR